MSNALAKASWLKPEIRLAQAVSQFEADLSNEQKTAFRTLKSQCLNSPPGPSEVMRLTAEMDRQMSRKVGGRCFGPRFTNFLQGVQQFSALGDVVVGGSQNIIACGVWSLVRMSLIAIVNFSSYIEKLSALFMEMGRSAPCYQAMALIYPQSKSLQSALLEYFVVVVGLCHHLVKLTQKSAFYQVTTTLSDLHLKVFQTDLDRWACSIKEEILLIEAQESSQSRALSNRLSKLAVSRQRLATKLRVLDFCSQYDHETTWKQTRKVGNTSYFTQFPEYQEWKSCSKSCTLVYTGKLGSGKSVLLANIVDDLNIHAGNDKVAVAYFFCRHDISESLNARTILGSLARQLLRSIPDLAILAEVCEETSSTGDTEKVLKILSMGFPHDHKAYFVLDGLDECDQLEREALALELGKIQTTLKLLLCTSFRIEPKNGLEYFTSRFVATLVATIPDDNPDIEAFIEVDLERCLRSRKLVIRDPTLILEIQNALLNGSQGMFLWVVLQVQSLCGMRTDEAIRDALADLPKDLSETYSRILHESSGKDHSYQEKILRLIVAAYRPLTTDELRDALSVIPGDTAWTAARLLNDVHSALACCGCLLTVDEEETTVRFIHHSVKKFVLNNKNSNDIAFTAEIAHRTMADIIVTYLNYGMFGTELSRTRVRPVMIQSAPFSVVRATTGSSSTVQSFALKLLKSRKRPNFDIGKTLAEARKPFHSNIVEEFPFYTYTTAHWIHHICYVSGRETILYDLSVRVINQRVLKECATTKDFTYLAGATESGNEGIFQNLIDSGKLSVNSTDQSGYTLLLWAAQKGYETIVKPLLSTRKVDVNCTDQFKQTPLCWAAKNGHGAVVKLLLNMDEVDINRKDDYGRTPLLWAACKGHETVVELLLGIENVDIDSKDDQEGRTPLSWAVQNGHEAVIKLLLNTGKADVNSEDYQCRRTPLSWAADSGSETVTKLLLNMNKVNVNSMNELGQTPLSSAAWNGHDKIVQLLLSIETINADSMDKYGQTPLSLAAQNGHGAVVKMLLSTASVEVDSKDHQYGRTPLSWAAKNGHEAVVKILLSTGKAEVESKNHQDGRTPLSWAAQNGHEVVVDLLINTGKVDVDSKDYQCRRTPLSWAADNGHEAIVKRLVSIDNVDVNAIDGYGQTPLSSAARKGYEAVVKLLLSIREVEVDSKDKYGQTPLLWAARNGHETIVGMLLDTGNVDTDVNDYQYGRTPLSWAAQNGHEGVARLLLSTRTVDIESKDRQNGRTPLWWAAQNGHEAVVKMLLCAGKLDVNLKDHQYGRTPLSWAAQNGHEAVVKILLSTGKAEVESRDYQYGWTPLWWAAQNGHEAVVKLLLSVPDE